MARVRTQVRRKRYADRLRDSVQNSLELAVTDQLTGLYNRRYLDSHVGTLFTQSVLRARPLSLLVLDLDKFKLVNDTYGHDVGDEVLKEFAFRVQSCTRGIDIVARMGGEEIVIVLPDTALDAAQAVAERIRAKVHDALFEVQRGAGHIPVTVSIGAASRRPVDATTQDLFKRADEALYKAKEQGRNRVVASAA